METLIISFSLLSITLWVWAIFDLVKHRRNEPLATTIWFWIVILFPVFGSIFYFQLKDKFLKIKSRKFRPDFNR